MRAVSPAVVPRSTGVDMGFEWERRCLTVLCNVYVKSVCVIVCGKAAPQGHSDGIEGMNHL